jgi:hypothetical protein
MKIFHPARFLATLLAPAHAAIVWSQESWGKAKHWTNVVISGITAKS